jgi:uncharacterized membrane protein YfcA
VIEWITTFIALMLMDICWVLCVRNTKDGADVKAASWAVVLFLTGAAGVIAYTANRWLLIPACAGTFAGTYVGVRFSKPITQGKPQ